MPTDNSIPSSHTAGANLIALGGIGLVGYGLMFLIRNFTRFIELGLTPERIGGTPEQIRAFSPHLYNYISHLQVAVVVAVPLHYVYGLAALGHLGPIYLVVAILLVGTVLAQKAVR